MITSKSTKPTKSMTPQERKEKVIKLREEHEPYFINNEMPDALFIPKMAYRPSGKDELHISFFPSELEKKQNIYTEFVSIDYDIEDPKRTLYMYKFNAFYKDEYEIVESNAGFQRYMIPVSELKIINDVNSRNILNINSFDDLPNPDEKTNDLIEVLKNINETLKRIEKKIK